MIDDATIALIDNLFAEADIDPLVKEFLEKIVVYYRMKYGS